MESLRESIVAACRSTQVVPAATLNLIKEVQNEDYSVDEVARAIQLDPVLTAHVLRVSNSSIFRPATPILSVPAAITRLGRRNMLQALVASIGSYLPDELEGYGLMRGALWEHALAVSLATQLLAETLGRPGAEVAATAGLLTDMGKLVLDPFLVEHGERIHDLARKRDMAHDEAERQILGIDHAEAGALLLQGWQLPATIVSVVRWHHLPEQCPDADRGTVDLVHLAECICSMGGFGLGNDGIQYKPSQEAAARIGYSNVLAEWILCGVFTSLVGLETLYVPAP